MANSKRRDVGAVGKRHSVVDQRRGEPGDGGGNYRGGDGGNDRGNNGALL